MKKRILSVLLAVVLLTGICPKSYAFNDIQNSPYATEILYLKSLNVISGTSSTTYSPNDMITYSQYASILAKAFGLLCIQTGTWEQQVLDAVSYYTLPSGKTPVSSSYVTMEDAIALALIISDNIEILENPYSNKINCTSGYEHYIYTAIQNKIIEPSKLTTGYTKPITGGQAAYIAARVQRFDSAIGKNIVAEFMTKNVYYYKTASGKITSEHLNILRSNIEKIPTKVLKEFMARGFKIEIALEMKDIWPQHSTAVGVFSMANKSIAISLKALTTGNNTLVHEFGHFIYSAYLYSREVKPVYTEELSEALKLLREYSVSNVNEYFADMFVLFTANSQTGVIQKYLPKTYRVMRNIMAELHEPNVYIKEVDLE